MTASKLFGVLVPRHANYKVAHTDADGSLRGSVHRYGDLNEADSAAASEVVQEAVGQEIIIQDTVVQQEETIIQEEETVIQEEETVIQEEEAVFQEEDTVVQDQENVIEENTAQEQDTVVQEITI